jgi:hypothetical protein
VGPTLFLRENRRFGLLPLAFGVLGDGGLGFGFLGLGCGALGFRGLAFGVRRLLASLFRGAQMAFKAYFATRPIRDYFKYRGPVFVYIYTYIYIYIYISSYIYTNI